MIDIIQRAEGMGPVRGRWRLWLYDVRTGKFEFDEGHNLYVTTGKNAVAARLAGKTDIANRGEITYGAVGTSNAAPSAGQTTLVAETFRKILATRLSDGNVATLRAFFGTAEANGSLREFGLFGENASGTANSGTMFNRLLINKEKTSVNTLTIEVQITVG